MVNFFAALDDSGDESEQQVKKQPESKPKKDKEKSTKKVVVVSTKPQDEPRGRSYHNDRNPKSGRSGGSRSERERQAPRDGKRAYERRSGTGRGREIKKSGGGARNWGSDKDDARNAEGLSFEEKETNGEKNNSGDQKPGQNEIDGGDAATEVKEDGDALAEEPPKEEEEDKTMTYEEYLAQKEEQRLESEAFKPIAMRELENEFAGLVGKKGRKETEEENFLKMGKGKQPRKKGAEKKDKEKIIPKFRVQDANRRSSGDRNRRDGDRSSRSGGRGSGRNYNDRRGSGNNDRKPKNQQVNVADMNSFPSL